MRTMICYKYNNKILNEETLLVEMESLLTEALNNPDHKIHKLAQALYKLPTVVDAIENLKREGQIAKKIAEKNPGKYISVTDFGTASHIVHGKETGRLTPKYTEEQRKNKFIEDHKNDSIFNGDIESISKSYDE
jgi:hypothetical protein